MHQQQTAFENTVEKGEIARNEQFFLFPQCFLIFQIILSPFVHIFDISLFATEFDEHKIGISGKGIDVENIVRKGEIACNKQSLLLSQCFLLPYMALSYHFKCSL